MADSVLAGTIAFFFFFCVYDVVLPFILVFTLFFAFLEKSKLLGEEVIRDSDGKEHTFTRKNFNAMIAFSVAFFVVASAQLVRIISEIMANTVIILVTGLCFMLALGITHTGKDEFKLPDPWKKWFWGVSAAGILLILFNALGWLNSIYAFLVRNWNNTQVATVIMVLVFVGFIIWITAPQKTTKDKSDDDDDDD